MNKQNPQPHGELDSEYSLLMSTLGVSVSKHLMDDHFTLIWANDYYYELIGFPKGEYEELFHNHCDMYFADNIQSWDLIVAEVTKAVKSGKSGYEVFAKMRRKSGDLIWTKLVATFTGEYYNGYQISYTVIMDVDDMMQMRMEQNITYDNIPGFIGKYRVSGSGLRLIEANDKLIDFFGIDKDDMESVVVFDTFSEASKRDLKQHLPALLRGESVHFVVQAEGKHGNNLWLQFNGESLGYQNGEMIYLIVYIDITDITEQRELQKKLEESALKLRETLEYAEKASRAKSDFLARMSHDIRTPMNAIMGMTAIAGAHIEDTDRVQDCLHKINGASSLLLGLINEVLDMSKIESGRLKLSEDSFNIGELVQDLVIMMQPEIKRKGHRLDVHFSGMEHEWVISDLQRMRQVLMNILSNAVKYTPDNGHIVIRIGEETSPGGQEIYTFVFEDNGRGMEPEFLAKIFEPFERADDTKIHAIQGTGLGMAISHNIVQMMGGELRVESVYGEGSCFTIRLPLRQQADNRAKVFKWPGGHVLVVDDDPIACESTTDCLKAIGVPSMSAGSGTEALARLGKMNAGGSSFFTLVMLDMKMPGMDGIETAARIRELSGTELPIIMVSAYDTEELEEEAREAGVNHFISKPLFKSKLIQVFREFILGEDVKSESHHTRFTDADYSGKRILLVEDNELNREIALEIVGSTGAEMVTAFDGLEAVRTVEAAPEGYFDMILMDIQMPIMDGYEATRRIRKLDRKDVKSLPIIAMTANAFSEDVQKAREAGMNYHMSKPIDITVLMKVLGGYL